MSSTKELRNRIKSIKNTSKVTKAMEMVSAAKMRRAQEQAVSGRSYSEILNEVLDSISTGIDPNSHPLLLRETTNKIGVLLVTTDRGLIGALNANLFKKALSLDGNIAYITIGKKGRTFISKSAQPLVADFELLEKPTVLFAKTIASFLIDNYLKKEFDKIFIVYSSFKNTLSQVPAIRQILPVINLEMLTEAEGKANFQTEYLFEPSADHVLSTILPFYIEMEIYQILLEASASEHSARMVAMKNASDNANDLVEDLTLAYNQVRQANITNELLDITTASLALE